VKAVDFTEEATAEAMKCLMKLPDPPTAIFCFKNYMTLDAIEFLKKYHPDKIDVIDFAGFGNLPMLQYLDHKPSASIEESSFEMGIKAAELLLQAIENDGEEPTSMAINIQIPCKLVIHK
jgi:LacI family transcriptional regulator